MEYSLEFDDKEVDKMLKGIIKRAQDRKNIWERIQPTIYADVMRHFEAEEGPDGKWLPRSETTNLLYERAGHKSWITKKLLQISGTLRQDMAWSEEGETLVLTARAPYAAIQNYGGQSGGFIRGAVIPRREFMWLSDKSMQYITANILEYITDGK